jgi:hypothetical protein
MWIKLTVADASRQDYRVRKGTEIEKSHATDSEVKILSDIWVHKKKVLKRELRK